MKWTSVFCLTCTFLCATLSTEKVHGRDQWFQKADSLYVAGAWFEASIAYERSYYLSENALQRVLANLAKAEALKQMGEYSKAHDDLQRSLAFRGSESLRLEVLYQMALCAYMDGDDATARSLLLQILHQFGPIPQQRIFLLKGLVMVDQARWDDLRQHLEVWADELYDDNAAKDSLLTAFDVLKMGDGLPRVRDPERARLWSAIIPGSGQAFAGSPGWGALNAISQLAALTGFGLLAWNGYYIAGVVAGLGPFQSFYFGGIRQAGELAEQNNSSRLERFQTAMGEFLLDVARQSDQ